MQIMPICLAWAARRPLSEADAETRLQAILRFLHLEDRARFNVHLLVDGHCGLFFIDDTRHPFGIPLCHRTAHSLSVSAYLPFGAGSLVDRRSLTTGEYLRELPELLRATPGRLTELAPPQLLCSLDAQRHSLTLNNDWRGFGRLYAYRTAFGAVWSNKMAAALLFAGVPARADASALADMAACGMCSGNGTGYQNLRLADPGISLDVATLSGTERLTRLGDAPDGLPMAAPDPDAVEKVHDAMSGWMRDLALFRGEKNLRLNLSGGRDSRVVGAALLASGLDCEITLCSPPVKDAELAATLLRLADRSGAVEEQERRAAIEAWYAAQGSLPDIAATFLRKANTDISVKLFFSWPTAIAENGIETIHICGDQGEVAHNCYYTATMVAEEKVWLRQRNGPSPCERRIHGLVDAMSVKSFGATPSCGRQAAANIKNNELARAEALGLRGFYVLDFLYLHLYLNRQWPGANGAFDRKTPLTVHPYVRNAFHQPLEAKLDARFVRDVIASFLPAWRDVPFFHELPREQTEDFYVAYPTYWEMGRGEEVLALCDADSDVWQFFDRTCLRDTFAALRDKEHYASLPSARISAINTTAQKLLWLMALEKSLTEINRICATID